MKPIVIVGGGIIGLFSAYYLQKAGKQVLILEKGNGDEGCSFGNAGMVVPSHFVPLATPGMLEKGFKWMFDNESPFYVKPRLSLDLLKWGLGFIKAANQKKLNQSIPYLRDIGMLSRAIYHDLAKELPFFYEEKGLLMYCKTEGILEEEAHTAQLANKIGIEAKVLTKKEVDILEPELNADVVGGVYFPGDTHLNPTELVSALKNYLKTSGVIFKKEAEVVDFEIINGNIEKVILLNKEEIVPEKVVLAAGSWSENIGRKLKLNLPIQAGKGYSVSLPQIEGKKINIPSIFVDARVAITPMSNSFVRFGGTMEIGGINDKINMNRVKGIIKSVPNYFPEYPIEIPAQEKVWFGLRPCSPDGLPYIGKSHKINNLYLNTGHAMMGVSLAPASGLLLSEIVLDKQLSMKIDGFAPERF